MSHRQPTASVLTPTGRGAVATIRYIGDVDQIDAADSITFRAANQTSLRHQPIGCVLFGHWGEQPAEEIVFCRSGNEVLDIHCHGGMAAVTRIVADLEELNIRVIPWTELIEQTDGLFAAEWSTALSQATTERTAAMLLRQRELLPAEFRSLANCDWTDKSHKSIADHIDALLEWSELGLHLWQPWSVVLAGRPNVGKSSLINALLGYARSIVFDQPGTTRDVVTAETALDGWPIRFADTAGLRDSEDELESAGVDRARRQLEAADLPLLIFDRSQTLAEEDQQLINEWPNAIPIANKCDLPAMWERIGSINPLPVSAKTGEGIDELARTISRRLVPNVPDNQAGIPFTSRQIELLKAARSAVLDSNENVYRESIREVVES